MASANGKREFFCSCCACHSSRGVIASRINPPFFPRSRSSQNSFRIYSIKLWHKILKKQPALASKSVHLALIDPANPEKPLLAEYNGRKPVYPSSVIKMVYMGYVYQLKEEGTLKITPQVYGKLHQMIHPSSNTATAWIVDLWSGTCSGDERSPEDYREFAQDRNACNRWLRSLGIENINACQKNLGVPHPTR